jgi:hypothetical protein
MQAVPPEYPRITAVEARAPYVVALRFSDGSEGTVDLAPWIKPGKGIFAELQDPAVFAQVSVDREAGTIVWPNGADLDPDMLFEAAHRTPASA